MSSERCWTDMAAECGRVTDSWMRSIPKARWCGPDVLGIDLGIMLLMAENLAQRSRLEGRSCPHRKRSEDSKRQVFIIRRHYSWLI